MSKSGNTAAYRKAKRVTSFVKEGTKNNIKKAAKIKNRSVSAELAYSLELLYGV